MEKALTLHDWEKEWDKGNAYGLAGALTIGKAATAINDGDLWGTKANSFKEYIQMERGYGYSQVSNFMLMYKETNNFFLAHPELNNTLPTRVIQLLPHLTESNKEELLNSAALIPDARGWSNTIRKLRKLTPSDECSHKWEPWEHCTSCPAKRKIV